MHRLAIVLVLIGCRGNAGEAAPPCSAAAARFVDLARLELARATPDEASSRAVTAQLPAMRDALARACTEGAWSAATRKCLVAAVDHLAFQACERELTDEQRRDLDRATRSPADTP